MSAHDPPQISSFDADAGPPLTAASLDSSATTGLTPESIRPESLVAALVERDEHAHVGRPSMLRNLAHLMSSQLLTWTLAMAVQVSLTRFLGPAGLGQLRLATAVWAMAGLLIGLGTGTYLTLEIARDRRRGLGLVGPITAMRVGAFFFVAALLAVVGLSGGVSRDTAFVFAMIGIGVLISTVGDVSGAVLMGLEQMSHTARAAILSKLAYSAVVIAVLIAGGDVSAVAAASITAPAVSTVVLWSASRRFTQARFHAPIQQIRAIIRASSPFLAFGAVLVVYHQIDTVVISVLVDATTLGWYSTADTLFGTLLFLPTIMLTVLAPRFGRLHHEDPEAQQQLARQSFATLVLLGVPIGLGTTAVANRLVVLLYGDEFAESGPVLAVFGIVLILTFMTCLIGVLATTTGKQHWFNLVMVVAIAASIPLDLILVPWTEERYGNGAIGGALAYIVTESWTLVAGFTWLVPYLIRRVTVVRLVKTIVAGGAMFLSMAPLRSLFPAVPLLVGITVYVTVILLLRTLSDDDWTTIRRGVSRLRGSGATASAS